MPASTHTVHGAPCWVSLMTRDLEAAQRFYGAVLGWSFRETSLGSEFAVAVADDVPVAGIGALAHTMGVPVSWTAYFAVETADLTASRIRERGGTVGVGPISIGKGRAALAADPGGAVFGFWEGSGVPGWEVGVGKAPAWLELRTRDAFAAAIFYGQVFDWASGRPGAPEVEYELDAVRVKAGGHTVAHLRGGVIEADPDPQVRPRWHVYFVVEDVDAAANAAVTAGGTVTAQPSDSRIGREATVRDPHGGLFTVTAPRTEALEDD
ncbi:VOC family protein [Streptomyces sp. NPDC051776]|uniref:VOC family protein n=1 Tax=Streptomyces sp. NPDC051776 TaxID=3155414 RepID=UPI00342DF2F7